MPLLFDSVNNFVQDYFINDAWSGTLKALNHKTYSIHGKILSWLMNRMCMMHAEKIPTKHYNQMKLIIQICVRAFLNYKLLKKKKKKKRPKANHCRAHIQL